ILYSVGAGVNLAAFPPWFCARFFTPHELFHVLVLAAAACHYYFMLAVLVPFRRLPAFADEAPPALRPAVPPVGVVLTSSCPARRAAWTSGPARLSGRGGSSRAARPGGPPLVPFSPAAHPL